MTLKLKNITFTIKINQILMDDFDINKIIVSNKVFCKNGCKCFIGYEDDEKVIPLCIMLQQRSGYA